MSMGQRAFERLMGAPMAAPETPAMKRLRQWWTGTMFVLAVLVLLTTFGPPAWDQVLAPFDLVGILGSAGLGARFLTRKRSVDDAWLARQVQAPSEKLAVARRDA